MFPQFCELLNIIFLILTFLFQSDGHSDEESDLEEVSVLSVSHTSEYPAHSPSRLSDKQKYPNKESILETQSDKEEEDTLILREEADTGFDITIAPGLLSNPPTSDHNEQHQSSPTYSVKTSNESLSKSSLKKNNRFNHSVTPKISNLKAETPESVSPRIFDSVKVRKSKNHDKETPIRSSKVSVNSTNTSRSNPVDKNCSKIKNDVDVNWWQENLSPQRSLKQATITQAFHNDDLKKSNMSGKNNPSQEEEDLAEAIQRSLQDVQDSQESILESLANPERRKTSSSSDKENEQRRDARFPSTRESASSVTSPLKNDDKRAHIQKLKERSPNILETLPQSTPTNLDSVKKNLSDSSFAVPFEQKTRLQNKNSESRKKRSTKDTSRNLVLEPFDLILFQNYTF